MTETQIEMAQRIISSSIADDTAKQLAARQPAQEPAVEPEADEQADRDDRAAQWKLLNEAAQRRDGFITGPLNGSSLDEAFQYGAGEWAKDVADSIVSEANALGVAITSPLLSLI